MIGGLFMNKFVSIGAWMDSTDKWRYRHYDDGDRGQYIHIDIPYDGGYGNYEGGHEIYRTPGYDSTGEYR